MLSSSARLPLIFSSIGHTYCHLLMLLYPTVVLALEPEFGLPYGDLISLSFVGFVLFGVGALPAGWLGDRWSATGMMGVFFLGTGAAAVLTGFARSPIEIAVGLALVGLFASIYHPVGIAWLVRHAEQRGKALGLNGVFGSIGIASGALVAGVLTEWIHWRAAFIVPGAVCFATGILFLLFMRGERARSVERAAVARPEPTVSRRDTARAFAVLSVTMLCAGIIFQANSVALPKLFAERLGVVDGALGAGGLVTLVYLFAGAMQIVGGHLADRLPLRRVYLLAYALQAPLLLLAAGLGGPGLVVVAAGMAALHSGAIPAESSLLARYSSPQWRATAFGAKFVLALGVSALGVPLVGLIHDATGGFAWLLVILAALAATTALAATLLPGEGRAPAPFPPATDGAHPAVRGRVAPGAAG